MNLDLIKQFYYSFLPELNEEEWVMLTTCFTFQKIKKGDHLFKEGKICRHVSFINKGLFCFYSLNNGKQTVYNFLQEGEYSSDYQSFLTQQPGIFYLEALEDSEVIELDYDTVQEAYRTIGAFQKFGRLIAEYSFIWLCEINKLLRTATPEEHYQHILNTRPDILQRVPQYLIASYIGVTPEALSRIRKRMAMLV